MIRLWGDFWLGAAVTIMRFMQMHILGDGTPRLGHLSLDSAGGGLIADTVCTRRTARLLDSPFDFASNTTAFTSEYEFIPFRLAVMARTYANRIASATRARAR